MTEAPTHRVPPAREKDPDLPVTVPRILARELTHDRQCRRIALPETRLVAQCHRATDNTAHARRLDSPRRSGLHRGPAVRPPDTVVAMALAYHAFKAGRQPGDYGVTI